MIQRQIGSRIQQLFKRYPVVTITGPRQSGKTTLVRALFGERPYFNLERLEEREFAVSDPRGFLARAPHGAVIDEIQRAPGLLSEIQVLVDEHRRNELFVLTGSQHFHLLDAVTQSLAGRTALFRLLPFSLAELVQAGLVLPALDELVFTGLYPRVHDERLPPAEAYADYVETYVERDLRQLAQVGDLLLFRHFMRLCAGRAGQLLNLSGIAAEIGVTLPTVRRWLSLLVASDVVFLLEPFHANISKRLVRTPKLYFHDTGLACALLGVLSPAHLAVHPQRGNLYENLALAETLKHCCNRHQRTQLAFYRDKTGHEIDLMYPAGHRVAAIEIKSGATVCADFFHGFAAVDKALGTTVARRALVYPGPQRDTRQGARIIGPENLDELLTELDALAQP